MAAGMTTAVMRVADALTGTATALPVLSATGSGIMTASIWSTVVLLVGSVAIVRWTFYVEAVWVGRLHRQVPGTRATLEAQLVHRAEATAELVAVPFLDPASGLLFSCIVREALNAEGSLVDDGLDTSVPLEDTPSSHPASSGVMLPTPTIHSWALIEPDLGRVLRTVVSEPTRHELSTNPLSLPAFDRLNQAYSHLVLARRFHSIHISETQAPRTRPLVRMCHLAGHTPVPQTFDADDDTTPEAPPERDGEVQPR